MPNSSLRMITKVQLSKHQGPAIKIHYLTILSILSNQDIPAHPSTDTPLFFLKTLLRYLLLCPSRGSLPNLSLPSPGNSISFVPRIWCLGVFSEDSEVSGVWVYSLWPLRLLVSGCVLCGIQGPSIWVCSVWNLWPLQCLISGCPTYMLNRQSDFFLLLSKTVLRSQEATFLEFTPFVP